MRGFVHQYGKVRDIGIPLDQRWQVPESVDRVGIKLPDGVGNGTTVSIDQQRNSEILLLRVAGEMHFPDVGRRQRIDVVPGIETMVDRIHIDIVDIAQQAAAGLIGKTGEKFPFGNGGVAECQVAGDVLDQYLPPQQVLGFVDPVPHEFEGFFGVWER